MFAMRLACDIVDHSFHIRASSNRMWYASGLRNVCLDCLAPYIEQVAERREVATPFEIELLRDDLRRIEDKIALFSTLAQMPIVETD